MFSWLKRKLEEFEDRDYKKRLEEYELYVQKQFDEKRNKIDLNASIKGRDCIQEKIIFFTNEIRILCKNRKSIFSDNILNLIETIASEKNIIVITFDGEVTCIVNRRSQTRTIIEYTISNTRYTVWYCDRSQTRATIERTTSNTRHAVGDCDRS